MGLFGLGSFGEGFVKGFATEANEALKRDIERINTRVEKVADFRVKKAVEEQDKRKEDLEDIEDALREAEGLFGADDPRATAYAASLLKQEGSTAALKSFVSQIKNSKQYQSGTVNLANFMEKMEEEMPTGTRSDYARAFLGEPMALSDYRLPDDAVTAGAGNLISAIGLKPNISGQVNRQISEQMAAMGVDVDATATKFQLPSIKFMREDFTVSNMSPAERVTYYTTEMNKPENADDVDYYKQKRQEQLNVVAEVGGLQDQLDANVQMYNNTTDPAEKTRLSGIITNLSDEVALGEASMTQDRSKEIDVLIKQAQRKGQTEVISELMREKETLAGKVELLPDTIARLTNELGTAIQNGDIREGSEADTDARAEIARLDGIQKSLPNGSEISTSALNSAASFIDDEVDLAVSELPEISGEDYLLAVQLLKQGKDIPETLMAAYEKGQAARNRIKNGIYAKIRDKYADNDEIISVLDLRGSGVAQGSVLVDPTENIDELAFIENAVTPSTSAVTPTTSNEEKLVAYPKTEQGIDSIVSVILDPPEIQGQETMQPGSPSDVYRETLELHGDKQFAIVAEFVAKNQGRGVDPLDVRIAKMSLTMDVNEIIQTLKNTVYKNDPSFDIQSISSTVSKVLTQLKPENRDAAAANAERAKEYQQQRKDQVLSSGQAIPTGLMSRQ